MKRLPSYIIAVAFSLSMILCGQEAGAGVYGHSVGIRLGNNFAADYKFYAGRHSAFDFTCGLVNPFRPRYQFLLFSGAYHFQIGTGVPGLTPYVGGGLSLGTQFGDKDGKLRDKVAFFLSADIPVGLEYVLQRNPVAFFFEWSPKVQIVDAVRFIPQSAAVGIRFRLPRLR